MYARPLRAPRLAIRLAYTANSLMIRTDTGRDDYELVHGGDGMYQYLPRAYWRNVEFLADVATAYDRVVKACAQVPRDIAPWESDSDDDGSVDVDTLSGLHDELAGMELVWWNTCVASKDDEDFDDILEMCADQDLGWGLLDVTEFWEVYNSLPATGHDRDVSGILDNIGDQSYLFDFVDTHNLWHTARSVLWREPGSIGWFNHDEQVRYDAAAARPGTQHLVLIRGPPGAGKSTFAKESFPDYHLLEADAFPGYYTKGYYCFSPALVGAAHDWCVQQVRASLLARNNVVVCNTMVTQGEVDKYRSPFPDQWSWRLGDSMMPPGVAVRVIRMQGRFQSVHNVPQGVVDRMRQNMQPIDDEEVYTPQQHS